MKRNLLQRVMDAECRCGYLQQHAGDPDVPVKFDAQTNEYYFAYGEKLDAKLFIWHCPMCGGRAPHSTRGNLFEVVGHTELMRLHALTAKLKTLDEVLTALGKPDSDREFGKGVTTPERGKGPPVTKFYRTLTYKNYSETADISVTVRADGRVEFAFSGKYIGPKTQS